MQLNYEDINLQYFPEFSDFDQNFLDTMKNFRFEKMSTIIIEDTFINKVYLKEDVLDYVCKLINFDLDEFYWILENSDKYETEDVSKIKDLINLQKIRLQKLILDFIYIILPLDFLIKISRNVDKYNIKNNIRQNIINLLEADIKKIINMSETLSNLENHLDAKDQKEKYKIITSKLSNKNNKIITENKFLIAFINEISQDDLDKLIDVYLDNKWLFEQLH